MNEQDIYQQAEQELSSIADFVRFAATQFHQSDLYFGHGTDNPWMRLSLLYFKCLICQQIILKVC